MLLVVQGFGARRYLGRYYGAELRIRTITTRRSSAA